VIAHLVLFRPRPDLSVSERESLAAVFAAALREIPTIRHAWVGHRFTHGRGYEQLMRVDYEYAAVLQFDDAEGLLAYLEHPAHQQLGERFFNAFADALMYDFELQEGQEGIAALVEALKSGKFGLP
jgi:antibiotic biosynthesis monooxygenase (ABM) superfamily enzyme